MYGHKYSVTHTPVGEDLEKNHSMRTHWYQPVLKSADAQTSLARVGQFLTPRNVMIACSP